LLLAAILALALLATPVALAAQNAGSATPAAGTEAEVLLRQASDRLAETQTVRFDLEIDGETYIDAAEQIRLVSAQGDLARPDSVDVEFQVELLGAQTVSIRMISIGAESWTTDLLTGEWSPSPEEFGYNPSILFDNQDGLGPVAGRLQDPEIAGEEEIGGRKAVKVVGTVSEDVIEPMTSGTIKGEDITITLWLDAETQDMLRLQIDEPDDVKENPATWTMTLTGHNSDLTIEKPDLDE
jgi:outer membrane lipoprotein-sorting protein